MYPSDGVVPQTLTRVQLLLVAFTTPYHEILQMFPRAINNNFANVVGEKFKLYFSTYYIFIISVVKMAIV